MRLSSFLAFSMIKFATIHTWKPASRSSGRRTRSSRLGLTVAPPTLLRHILKLADIHSWSVHSNTLRTIWQS